MASMFFYSKAAVERAMKIQEVLLRAMARKIPWWQGAEILGFSDRHLRRIGERYEEFGYESTFDKRRGQPSPKPVPMATVEKVLALYRDKYFDLNVRHFHEKLREQHEIDLSYTWVKSVLQGAGLVARQRQRGVHRKRRARRPLPGMLLHIDGSHHRWFQDERWYDLIVILDDATSEIHYAQLTEEESTLTVMAGLKEVIAHKGTYQHYAGYDPDTEQYRPLQDKRNVTLTMVCRMPDRRSNVSHVDFAHPFMHLPPRPDWVTVLFCNQVVRRCERSRSWRTKAFRPYDSKRVLAGTATEAAMSRKLVWIEQPLFRGFGCSECGWRFKPADATTATSFDDMMRNFELQRDKEFVSHVCADHSKDG